MAYRKILPFILASLFIVVSFKTYSQSCCNYIIDSSSVFGKVILLNTSDNSYKEIILRDSGMFGLKLIEMKNDDLILRRLPNNKYYLPPCINSFNKGNIKDDFIDKISSDKYLVSFGVLIL